MFLIVTPVRDGLFDKLYSYNKWAGTNWTIQGKYFLSAVSGHEYTG